MSLHLTFTVSKCDVSSRLKPAIDKTWQLESLGTHHQIYRMDKDPPQFYNWPETREHAPTVREIKKRGLFIQLEETVFYQVNSHQVVPCLLLGPSRRGCWVIAANDPLFECQSLFWRRAGDELFRRWGMFMKDGFEENGAW